MSAQAQSSGINARHFQRFIRDVTGMYLRMRKLTGQRQGNASGAGSDIHDAHSAGVEAGTLLRLFGGVRLMILILALYEFENGFDQVLGLRTRDEYCGRNQQVQSPEFLVSGDVLRGASASTLLNDFVVSGLLFPSELALGMSVEVSAIATENKQCQQLGVQARRRNIFSQEKLIGCVNRLLELHDRETLSQRQRLKQSGAFFSRSPPPFAFRDKVLVLL